MALLLGFGIGIWILGILWAIAIICSCVIVKARGPGRMAALGLVAVIIVVSIVLLVLPQEDPNADTSQVILYDDLFILRIVFIIFGSLCLIGALVFIFVTDILSPVYADTAKYQ